MLFPDEEVGDPSAPGFDGGTGAAPKALLKLPLHLLKEETTAPPLTPGSGTARTFYTARSSARDTARESARDAARRAGHSSYQPE